MEFKKLYIKSGKRYKEYQQHESIPNNQLYFKDEEGNLIPYNKSTMSWFSYTGIPQEGIWKVHRTGATRIGDFETTDKRIELEKFQEAVERAVTKAFKVTENQSISIASISREILNQIEGEIND